MQWSCAGIDHSLDRSGASTGDAASPAPIGNGAGIEKERFCGTFGADMASGCLSRTVPVCQTETLGHEVSTLSHEVSTRTHTEV